ncbi:MAG TPA: hypothetical protein VJT83_02915 [Chitinophagaceae bacterium]|nr:hypothetical protein [Chitinophagaceae bacterium]
MKKVIALGRELSKAEQMKISGGDYPIGSCSCSCNPGKVGAWTYDNGSQPPNSVLQADIVASCGTTGGTCNGCTHYVA